MMLFYKYKYNGKELQDELGLNVTAMDFRMYDNALGRFHNIDKMTDIMPSLSPYRFAFNNPVLWGDPTGLFESGGGDDDEFFLQGQEVVITPDSGVSQPASFNYALIDWSQVDNRKRPTLAQYNKHNGTSYTSFDDYYFNEHYVPAHNKMIKDMHNATGQTAKVCYAVAATLTGTAYLMPVLVAVSPAIQSTVATFVANPIFQNSMYSGMSSYAGINIISNGIGQSVASFMKGEGFENVNPVEMASSGFGGFVPALIGSTINTSPKNLSSKTYFNTFSESSNNLMVNSIGGGIKDNLQLPNSMMNNATIATYQGIINTLLDTGSSSVSNKLNENK